MKITGTHKLPTSKEKIWSLLQDPEVLARISPGISSIERIGDDQYRAISDIKIGPVRGSFEGDLSIIDKVDLETMTMVLSQKSKIGNAEAKIVMNLEVADNDATIINYNGSAKLSGTLATMGQRIMGGVVKTLTKQVFSELEKVIQEKSVGSDEGNLAKAEKVQDSTAQLENKSSVLLGIIDKINSIWKSIFG